MAPFMCCGFEREPSPDPAPILLIDNSQTRGRFPVSITETSESSAEAAAAAQNIFQVATDDGAPERPFQAKNSTKGETTQDLLRKQSMKSIHGVTNRVRKSMSRDSGILKRSPQRILRNSLSIGNVQRHREPKRVVHRRAASGLRNRELDSEGDYDEDAVPMKTPRSTWGKEQGATIEGTSQKSSKNPERSPSTSPVLQLEKVRRDVSCQTLAPNSATSTLSRMLTARGRQKESDSSDDKIQVGTKAGPKASAVTGSRNTQKYVFNNGDKSPEKLVTRTPSPLGRSDTVIRVPSSSAVVELGRPTFLDTLGTQNMPDSPNIGPQRMGRIDDSIAGRKRGSPYSLSHDLLNYLEKSEATGNEGIQDARKDNQSPLINAISKAGTRGASDLIQRPIDTGKLQGDINPPTFSTPQQPGRCSPTSRERVFGEAEDADPAIELPMAQEAYARIQSSGSNSVHLFNMHIPQRLASQTLLKSVSQSLLNEIATFVDHEECDFVDGKPRPRVSSSGFPCSRPLMAWGLLNKSTTSSIYSQDIAKKCTGSSVYSQESPYITPAESHQGSMMFLNKIADRMNHYGPDAPAQDRIKVPIVKHKQVDLAKLERRTRETSFHSSNESLYNRELAAAETRIVSRAKTVNQPKTSWFKEDFDEVAAAIATSNPRRRSVSEKLNRKPSLSSYDGNKERDLSIKLRADRFNFIAGSNDDTGASIWEKAIREHEKEDATISRTRLGSDPVSSDHHHFVLGHRRHKESSRTPHHRHLLLGFSSDGNQAEVLQAKLGAYQLPSPTRKCTPTDDLKSISAPSSHSSWTRYSSHDRDQRSSASAGEADEVFARDFAQEAASAARMANQAPDDIDPTASVSVIKLLCEEEVDKVRRKSKSMTFGRSALAKLRQVYRVGSLEFASRTAFGSYGHRSSVSGGKLVEYPELEMLPPLNPVTYPDRKAAASASPPQAVFSEKTPPQSEETAPTTLLELVANPENAESVNVVQVGAAKAAEWEGGPSGAKGWSKMYVEDCVSYPPNSPPQASPLYERMGEETTAPAIMDREVKEDESMDANRGLENGRQHEDTSESQHASPSDHMRESTLDFKKSLEFDEQRARERIMRLTVGNDAGSAPKMS